ncbi:hypothetical protein Golomagni_01357 [Golovinomyces magnicellulatus]|nr:hypothetical protein Golomagni_01357 [Golovinomyces magnicellulatus]
MVSTVGSNNLSLSHDEVLPLYALIPTKTYYSPPYFPYSLSGNVTSANSCLSAHIANGSVDDTTTAGYFSFVPTLLCIEGKLSQCEDGPVEDETAIQLCAVNTLDLGARGIVPNGVQKWVDTDVETAKNITRNPALTAETVPYEVGVSLEELGISVASRVNSNRRTWWIGLSVALGLIHPRCGLATSGTKSILYSRILHELTHTPTDLSEPKRILSIDMGIRNMAYCTLDLDPNHPTPLVHAWKNLAMSMTPVISPSIPPSILLEDQTHPEKREENPEEEEGEEQQQQRDPLLQPQISQMKEVFDPASMSKTAYTLLRHSLLASNPTHIIIERQRFRSNGAKHIFEWTLRVNMLEAILHAVLYTLQAEGIWKGSISVVSPSRVGPFWLLDHSQGCKLPASPRSKFKQKKIDLVRNWLENGSTILDLGKGDVQDVAKRYLVNPPRRSRKSLGMGKKSGNNTTPRKTKLDDLTDCLLQGLAWIQWEKNKSIASRCGLDAILSL